MSSVPSVAGYVRRRVSCGNCGACLRKDCVKCKYCKDKPKHGGKGTMKQKCLMRRCKLMSVKWNKMKVKKERKEDQKPPDVHGLHGFFQTPLSHLSVSAAARPGNACKRKLSEQHTQDQNQNPDQTASPGEAVSCEQGDRARPSAPERPTQLQVPEERKKGSGGGVEEENKTLKTEVKSLKEELEATKKALQKSDSDVKAMKKQAENLTVEYDRLLEKHGELQGMDDAYWSLLEEHDSLLEELQQENLVWENARLQRGGGLATRGC